MNERDPTDLDAIEQSENDKNRTAQAIARSEAEDLKWLMANRRGRRIVWKLMSNAGVYKPSFNTNAMTMSFLEGVRSLGTKLLDQVMNECPDMYFEMVKENTK